MTPFLILTLPRSGSYHLVSLLDSAPDLTCHGEVYKRERIELAPPLRRRLGLAGAEVARRDAMGAAFPRALEALSPGRATGFKAFPQHLRGLPHRKALLFAPGRARVILTRDPLERHLSACRARASGVWVRKQDAPPPPVPRIRFDPLAFLKDLEAARRLDRLAARMEAQAPGTVRRIDYAALSDPGALTELLRFLGSAAEGAALRSDRARQHVGRIDAGVENRAEMQAFLAELGLKRRAA